MTKNRTALISGASIAGLTTAYWLQKAGFEVTIVEKSDGLRMGGYGVDIRGTAVEVIKRMGILDEVRQADTAMEGVFLVTKSGALIQTNDAAPGSQHDDIEIMRDDLTSILYSHVQKNVTFLWNDSVATLEDVTGGMRVTFNSVAPRTFDIVVGADGVHSNTRRLVFGEEKQFSSFLDCYIAIFTTENLLDISHRHLAFNLPGKMVSMYSARKAEEAKAVFFFKSPQLSYDFRDTKAQKRLLAQAFAGEKAWIVPQLLRVMGGASDFYFDSLSQIHLPNWSTGNVVLVGDAAYGASPASGQGSSMAIVGAYILVQQLSRTKDYGDAFVAYQQKMTAYVEACQALAPETIEDMIIDSSLKFKMFSLMLRFPKMMQRMMKGGSASFNAKVAKAANSITLD